MSIAARQLRRVVIHIIPVARAIQMEIIKVLVIMVPQPRRVVLILNPIVMIIIAANPPNQIIIAVVIRRIAVQKESAITEAVEEIASLEAIHFFREDGF